ncbi:MAG: hypothetical protein IT373_37770 [Polyangiaceae bacterium]|nr:hypothetical protein [Polyangiaceae bacterium]
MAPKPLPRGALVFSLAVGLGGFVAAGACSLDTRGTLLTSSTASNGASSPGGQGGTGNIGAGGTGTGGITSQGGTGGTGGQGGFGGSVPGWVAGDPGADGTYTLPSWLTFSSPSPNKTVETSASTLRKGLGVNAPRARNVGGGWGLCVESARTNNATYSESWTGGAWVVGDMTVYAAQPDPAGGTSATHFFSPASANGHYGNYLVDPQGAAASVASAWLKGIVGSAPYATFRYIEGLPVTATTWTRLVQRAPAIVGIAAAVETRAFGQAAVITGDTMTGVYGLQVEPNALYPSTFIPTTTTPVTRAAERLYINDPAALFPNGYFSVEVEVAPRYAEAELAAGAEHDLLYFAADSRLFVRRNAGGTSTEICLSVHADEICVGPLTWAAETALTVAADHVPGGRVLSVAGADQGAVTQNAAALTPLVLGATVEVLGNGLPGAQECADLRRLNYAPVP